MGQIKGITDIWAAEYVGLAGGLKHFKSAGHVYSLSGLSPKSHQSGSLNKTSLGIRRMGNKQLRKVLYQMASQVMVCEPVFKEYHARIKKSGKHWKKIRVAICRKLNKTMFAMVRDRAPFRRDVAGSST
jgi:transposase